MPDPELTPSDISHLTDCRLIAAENYAFYDRMYDTILPHVDKDVLGRILAQKKEFMDALDMLMSTFQSQGRYNSPTTQPIVLSLPALDDVEANEINITEHINLHESRFDKVIRLTLEHINDETTQDVLRHHRDAATIANLALAENS